MFFEPSRGIAIRYELLPKNGEKMPGATFDGEHTKIEVAVAAKKGIDAGKIVMTVSKATQRREETYDIRDPLGTLF